MTSKNNKNNSFDSKCGVVFDDKRHQKRVSAALEVTLTSSHNFFSGITADISEGGVFIATHQRYSIGTEFNLTLTLEGKIIKVLAKVVWIRENSPFLSEDIAPGMGLNFVDINEDDLNFIENFLKKKEPLFFDTEI